jgi:hypothetical protein
MVRVTKHNLAIANRQDNNLATAKTLIEIAKNQRPPIL